MSDSLAETIAELKRLMASEPFLTLAEVQARYRLPHEILEDARTGRLLAGMCRGAWVFPGFQFGEGGQPLPGLAQLIPHLPRVPTDGGWTAVLWCFQPHHLLNDRRPCDVLAESPLEVIEAARRDSQPIADDAW